MNYKTTVSLSMCVSKHKMGIKETTPLQANFERKPSKSNSPKWKTTTLQYKLINDKTTVSLRVCVSKSKLVPEETTTLQAEWINYNTTLSLSMCVSKTKMVPEENTTLKTYFECIP